MPSRDLDLQSPEELDSFSRQHEGWIVSITTRSRDARVAFEAHEVPLVGVSRASASPGSNDIAISVGDSRSQVTHEVVPRTGR